MRLPEYYRGSMQVTVQAMRLDEHNAMDIYGWMKSEGVHNQFMGSPECHFPNQLVFIEETGYRHVKIGQWVVLGPYHRSVKIYDDEDFTKSLGLTRMVRNYDGSLVASESP